MKSIVLLLIAALLLSGCASYGKISNLHIDDKSGQAEYSIKHAVKSDPSHDITLALAFSGGGTRAAALSYGVLAALRDSRINLDGHSSRLLDEVDLISSVSGGSFTAAYFGLYGERIFSDFEYDFLRRDVQGELIHGLFNPGLWFSKRGRTEMAVKYYENKVFNGATFEDLYHHGGPLIVINASDLGRGVRFSFLQDYFDLICSDLSSFPVSRAVAASSAVPILFNPVVLKNHTGCDDDAYQFLSEARAQLAGSDQLQEAVDGLSSFALKDERRYIHLVDGGITDNLGLMSIYEVIEIAGGAQQFLHKVNAKPAPRLVVISVNASTSAGESLRQGMSSRLSPPAAMKSSLARMAISSSVSKQSQMNAGQATASLVMPFAGISLITSDVYGSSHSARPSRDWKATVYWPLGRSSAATVFIHWAR